MDLDSEPDTPKPQASAIEQNITHADRIKELNSIDQDISKVLRSASLAIRFLTAAPPSDEWTASDDTKSTLDKRKELFESHTSEFYTVVQSISAHLRRQTYALEEANIIAAEAVSAQEVQGAPQAPKQVQQLSSRPTAGIGAVGQVKPEGPMQITNGGLGNLDVGWLNSRRDVVGKQKEAELWRDARALLEKMDGETDEDKMETT